jgi:adenosylhomocysteine nucleosidase
MFQKNRSPQRTQITVTLIVLLLAFARGPLAQPQPIVGVLGIPSEITPLEKRLQNSRETIVRGHVFRIGTVNGRQVVIGRSAAGKVNAAIVATLLLDHFNPSAVFFSGTAGAIDPALRPGDVVIGATVAQHDVGLLAPDGIRRRGLRNIVAGEMDPLLVPAPEGLLAAARQSAAGLALAPLTTADGERLPKIVEGVIVTGDVFVADAGRRDELRKSLGAAAVEMEGAAVVQVCRQFRVPCLVIRSITDRADGQAERSYDQFITVASENAASLVAAIIGQREAGAR